MVRVRINGLDSREELITDHGPNGSPNENKSFLWMEVWLRDLFRRSPSAVDISPSLAIHVSSFFKNPIPAKCREIVCWDTKSSAASYRTNYVDRVSILCRK
ncbi:hypothetical protein TNCV_3652521 [Trichonephila clavipes]|nr:hypothetical protein TNCV_3652521 [Trichonephila clavipes]